MTLSDKRGQLVDRFGWDVHCYKEEDIKQAVKELKDKMFEMFSYQTGGTMGEIDKVINEIFGDKLI